MKICDVYAYANSVAYSLSLCRRGFGFFRKFWRTYDRNIEIKNEFCDVYAYANGVAYHGDAWQGNNCHYAGADLAFF